MYSDSFIELTIASLTDALYFELSDHWSNRDLMMRLSISNAEHYSDQLCLNVQTVHMIALSGGCWLYSDINTRVVR